MCTGQESVGVTIPVHPKCLRRRRGCGLFKVVCVWVGVVVVSGSGQCVKRAIEKEQKGTKGKEKKKEKDDWGSHRIMPRGTSEGYRDRDRLFLTYLPISSLPWLFFILFLSFFFFTHYSTWVLRQWDGSFKSSPEDLCLGLLLVACTRIRTRTCSSNICWLLLAAGYWLLRIL